MHFLGGGMKASVIQVVHCVMGNSIQPRPNRAGKVKGHKGQRVAHVSSRNINSREIVTGPMV